MKNHYNKMYQRENADDVIPEETTVEQVDISEPENDADLVAAMPDPIYNPEFVSDEPDPITEDPEPVIGVVVNCNRLNVRSRPLAGSPVVCTIVNLDEVMIDEEGSTDKFYKICTAAGIEGYCMKEFIVIREE